MNKIYFGTAVFFLLTFAFFSREVKHGFLKTTDFAVTVKIQEKIDKSSRLRFSALIGEAMDGAVFLGSPSVTSLLVVIITSVMVYDWKKKKARIGALLIPFMFTLIVVGELYGKSVVHHPSPPFFMIKNPPSAIFPKYYINEEFSYPSGHAARAVFIAIVLFSLVMKQYDTVPMKKKIWVGITLGIYGGLVALGMIYLGHHWFSDVAGGILLGSGCALFASL